MPSRDAISEVAEAGWPLTLVTPIMTRLGLRRLDEMIDLVVSRGWRCEIVANDFGALETLRNVSEVTVVAGRLLTRNVVDIAGEQLHFPSLEAITYLARHYRAGRLDLTSFRVKLEPPSIRKWPSVRLSLYHPYMYLATTRDCIFRFRGVPPEARSDLIGCSEPCKDQRFRLRYERFIPNDLYLRGNTMFIAYPRQSYSAAELAALHIDRVVEFVDLPL